MTATLSPLSRRSLLLRVELVALVCGMALTSVAFRQRIVAREATAATAAALDSAIVAQRLVLDTAAVLPAHVEQLAMQKREVQMAGQRAEPWGFALGGGVGITLSALFGLGHLAIATVRRRVSALTVRHPQL